MAGGDLRQLEIELQETRTEIWVTRKLGVPKNYYTEKLYTAYLKLLKLSYQGEWPTFLLLSGSMSDHRTILEYGCKGPFLQNSGLVQKRR